MNSETLDLYWEYSDTLLVKKLGQAEYGIAYDFDFESVRRSVNALIAQEQIIIDGSVGSDEFPALREHGFKI